MSVQSAVGNLFQHAQNQVISQLSFFLRTFFHRLHRQLCGCAIADDTRNILCTGTAFSLLRSAVYKGLDLHTFANIEETDSFRSMQLVSAGTEHVNMQFIHIDGHLSKSLHRIGVEQNSMFMGNLTNLPDGLDGTDLIIGKHYRYQNGIRADRVFQILQFDHTKFIDIQISDLISPLFQIFTGVQNRVMLNLGSNDMFSLRSIRFRSGFQRPVISLRTASSKIDFILLGTQCCSNLRSGLCHSFLALSAQAVDRGCITIMLCKIRQHSFHYLRRGLCGGRIVQINHFSHFYLSFSPHFSGCSTSGWLL